MKKKLCLIALILLLCLSVGIIVSHTRPNPEGIVSVTVTDATEDLEYPNQYPSLQFVNQTGYTNYEQISAYVAPHPNIKVENNVLMAEDTTTMAILSLSIMPICALYSAMTKQVTGATIKKTEIGAAVQKTAALIFIMFQSLQPKTERTNEVSAFLVRVSRFVSIFLSDGKKN